MKGLCTCGAIIIVSGEECNNKTKCPECNSMVIDFLAVKRYKEIGNRTKQRHHITYDPDWIVTVFKGEHQILTLLQRIEKSQNISKGFTEALKPLLNNIIDKPKVDLDNL